MKENNPKAQYRTVAIAVRYIPQYRQEFYCGLRKTLDERGVHLKLIYGQARKRDRLKGDMVDIPWAIRIENRILELGDRELYWQPIFRHVRDADLIIVEPGSRYLVNIPLVLLGNLGSWKIAIWGHGENPQESRAIPFSEWMKRWLARRVYWYFAYTPTSARVIRSFGYPSERITVVHNAIDTSELIAARAAINEEESDLLRNTVGLEGNHIALYVGGMYKEKGLEFLLKSCELIRQLIPDFEMLIIGSGVDAHLVMEFEVTHPWLHYLGPKFGREKVPYFAVAKLFLMPRAIGLAILDCLALGVPLVGTQNPDNGHEIDYLVNGKNGLLIEGDADPLRYAQVVSELLTNEEELRSLIDGCKTSAKNYSMENMIANFADGVLKALDS